MAGDGVHDRARVRAGDRDRHVQHGQPGARHDNRAAVHGRLQRAGLPRVGDVTAVTGIRDERRRRQVAGGQDGDVGVDAAVGGQVQAQRPVAVAAPHRDDRRGDVADPGRGQGGPFGFFQQFTQIAAVVGPGQEAVAAQPGPVRPAGQVPGVPGHRAHHVRGRVQQVRRMRGRVRLAEPVAAVPVDQGHPQRHLLPGGLPEQVDDGERAAGPPADHRDDWSAPGGGRIAPRLHPSIIIYYVDRLNRICRITRAIAA